MMTLQQIQDEQRGWSLKNFGPHKARWPALGIFEEVGELAHHQLKQEQKIRGTHEEHEANKKDSVADCLVFLLDYCTCMGWVVSEDILIEPLAELQASDEVKSRDINWDFMPKLFRLVYDTSDDGTSALTMEEATQIFTNLAVYCNRWGYDMHACLEATWLRVRERDFTKDTTDGGQPKLKYTFQDPGEYLVRFIGETKTWSVTKLDDIFASNSETRSMNFIYSVGQEKPVGIDVAGQIHWFEKERGEQDQLSPQEEAEEDANKREDSLRTWWATMFPHQAWIEDDLDRTNYLMNENDRLSGKMKL